MDYLQSLNSNDTNSTQDIETTSVRALWNNDKEKHDLIVWIVCCITFVIVVFALSTLQWYRKERSLPRHKRKQKLKKHKREREKEKDAIKRVSVTPIKKEEFLHHFDHQITADGEGSLPYELKAISSYAVHSTCSVGALLCNDKKNFLSDFLPFDHNRVRLASTDDSTSDYINASYVYEIPGDVSSGTRYIAAQSPLKSTVTDFWRMVWQEDCRCIVMLTDIFTYSRQECAKYWHETVGVYGDITVTLKSLHKTLHYTIRKFAVAKEVDGVAVERSIHQYQLHGWTAELLPNFTSILDFRRKVKLYTAGQNSPPIIHSSTGSGRTGVYIALDLVLDKLDRENTVDILGTIIEIRRCRLHFIAETVLLETLYRAVYTYIQCGSTVIPVSSIADLQPDEQIVKPKEIDHQYKVLGAITPTLSIAECAAGHRVENKEKSRDILLQPPERARPHLRTFDLNEHSDFINAVYVDGYSERNQFIMGQWPVRASINDFWRLVLDDRIAVTVVLHSIQSSGRNYPTFWPTAHCSSARYGPVRVAVVRNTETTDYDIRTFSIRKYVWNPAKSFLSKECVTMQLIFLKTWPDDENQPVNWLSLVNLIDLTQKWTKKQGKLMRPAFIMSKDGIKRAGFYCSLSLCVEQITTDDEVDMFNAVKTTKYNRPEVVNKAEFEVLHSVITKFIRHKYFPNESSAFISQELHAAAIEEFELLQYLATSYGSNGSANSNNNAQTICFM